MTVGRFLLAALLSIWALTASAQTINFSSGITNPGGPVVTHNISDDGYVHVPLQFGFPYYGQTFTNSWMFDNGIVAFMDPIGTQANTAWNAEQFSQGMQPRFSYMIAPLWSDLKPVASTTYTTQGNQQSMTYTWTNLAEFYEPANLNTFSLQIKPSGFIGVDYTSINLTQSNVSVGLTGDLEQGQYVQHFWAPAGTNIGLGSIPNWNVTDTGVDQCAVDPLSSPTCSGYNDAYFDQQCSADALYDPACAGYDTAYFDQQCSTNALYDPACAGYTTAYYDQQCGLDPLYHTGCAGYDEAYFDQQCAQDSLYNSKCKGYDTAYHNQQCSLNPLYDDACAGYDDAYYVQQCDLDALYDSGCTGYEVAYFDQQCGLDALYDQSCPGYAVAYFDQQCGLDALYDQSCPGYAVAYFDQQCGIDALYDNTCPGYAEAYAKKYILSAPTIETAAEPTAATAVTEEHVVAQAVAETAAAPTASPADTTAAVQLVAEAAPAVAQTTAAKVEAPKAEPAAAAPRTTRQALAQQRLAAARAAAVESARDNADAVSDSMDSADSMEQQVELQGVVMGAMGFVAGFDAYGRVTLPDGVGYAPFEIYSGQQNIDTPAARGLLGRSDRLHQTMIDQQYGESK